MHQLGIDRVDEATKVALTRNDVAHQSVQALLDDLRYVATVLGPADRAEAAKAVLAHHEPPVAESLLSDEGRRLQRRAREALAAFVEPAPVDDIVIVPDAPGRPPRPAKRRITLARVRSVARQVALVVAIAGVSFALGAVLQRLV